MKNTSYTVLMSVYIKEKAEYLKLSIQSMLDQTVPPDEFILVKDGPLTMELDAVVDYYNQKYPGLFTIISNETNKNDGDMIYESAVKNKARAEFWSDYGKLSYTELIDKYIPYSKKEAIMDKVKRVMVSTGLSKNLKIKKLLTTGVPQACASIFTNHNRFELLCH